MKYNGKKNTLSCLYASVPILSCSTHLYVTLRVEGNPDITVPGFLHSQTSPAAQNGSKFQVAGFIKLLQS